MKRKQHLKKIIVWITCLALIFGTVNLVRYPLVVQAEESSTRDKEQETVKEKTSTTPSSKAYMYIQSIDETRFNNIYNLDDGERVALYFGNDNNSWYVAGKENSRTLVLLCNPDTPLTSKSFMYSKTASTDEISVPDTFFGIYDRKPSTIYCNHYGASSARASLISDVLENNFSEEDRAKMIESYIATYDMKNKTNYILRDKIYLPNADEYDSEYITVGNNLKIGEEIAPNNGFKVKLSKYMDGASNTFQLRTPATENCGYGETTIHKMILAAANTNVTVRAVNNPYKCLPAIHIVTDSILFGAAVAPCSTEGTIADIMTIRYVGNGTIKSQVLADANGLSIMNGNTDEYVYVMGNDGENDWVWSKQIEGDETILAERIKQEKNLENIDLEKCNVWVEKMCGKYAYATTYHVQSNHIFAPVEGTDFHKCKACQFEEQHDYSKEDINVENAKKADATCTNGEMYYKSCTKCDLLSTKDRDVFEYGAPLGHQFESVSETEHICRREGCGYQEKHHFIQNGVCDSNRNTCEACDKKNIGYKDIQIKITNPIYNATKQKPIVSIQNSEGMLELDKDYEIQISEETNVSKDGYNIVISGIGEYAGIITKKWYMEKLNPEISDLIYSNRSVLTYNGKERENSIEPKAGLSGFGKIIVKYKEIQDSEIRETPPVDVGTYMVYAYIEEGENYNSGIFDNIGSIVIEPAQAYIKSAPKAKENLTYNDGNAISLLDIENVKVEGGTLVYRLGETGDFSENVPVAKDVGKYKIYYKVIGDKNHLDGEVDFVNVTVEKKSSSSTDSSGDLPTDKPSGTPSPTVAPSGKPNPTVAPSGKPVPAPVVKPAKAKIASAKNKKKNTITVKIKKAKNAKSYKIQYATDKKYKKAKTKTSKSLTVTLKGLKKKKTYYIRVCGVNGKVVGAWSGVKKVKVKK